MLKCTNENHDHSTTDDGNGGVLAEPVPMTCMHCGRSAHYDRAIEWYQHDDAPDCWRMQRSPDASPCALIYVHE